MTGRLLPLSVARKIRFQRHDTLTACWIWTGHIGSNGVGYYNDKTARQTVYERLIGAPPRRLDVHCGQGLCVNPHHTNRIDQQSVV